MYNISNGIQFFRVSMRIYRYRMGEGGLAVAVAKRSVRLQETEH